MRLFIYTWRLERRAKRPRSFCPPGVTRRRRARHFYLELLKHVARTASTPRAYTSLPNLMLLAGCASLGQACRSSGWTGRRAYGVRLEGARGAPGPPELNWSWTAPARTWLVANRAVVLSTSVALLAGLWGGAVLGRVSAGAPAFEFAQLDPLAPAKLRVAHAPRAGVPGVDGMAFVRAADGDQPANRARADKIPSEASRDQSINYADYVSLAGGAVSS